MSASEPEATQDYSNKNGTRTFAGWRVSGSDSVPLGAPGALLGALALAGVILCVAATFTPVIEIVVLTARKATYTGMDRHSVALLLIGAFALAVILGAARGAQPAMLALAACGVAVLLIAILGDLPHLDDAGVWPRADSFEDARAQAGTGYFLETAAGVLLFASGVGMLLVARGRRS